MALHTVIDESSDGSMLRVVGIAPNLQDAVAAARALRDENRIVYDQVSVWEHHPGDQVARLEGGDWRAWSLVAARVAPRPGPGKADRDLYELRFTELSGSVAKTVWASRELLYSSLGWYYEDTSLGQGARLRQGVTVIRHRRLARRGVVQERVDVALTPSGGYKVTRRERLDTLMEPPAAAPSPRPLSGATINF